LERQKRADLQKARGGYRPRKHSAETKAKIKQKSTGTGNGMYGRTQTDETKQKIRENRTPAINDKRHMSLHWILISPGGTKYEQIGDLTGLCKKAGSSFSTMHAAYLNNRVPNRGNAKGWQITSKPKDSTL